MKLRLLLLIALGGIAGTLAALVPRKSVQLALVAIAAGLGLYAGLAVRQDLSSGRDKT